jgi:murein DD-endopeptidase MepM/ murein hydrolase activator NlpD
VTVKRILVAAAAAALLGGVIFAAPAYAATARNGVCEDGEVCLYFNSDNEGSLVDFSGSVKDYGTGADCVKFISAGNGRGQCVKNNAASVWNRKSVPVTIFFHSDWSGAIDSFIASRKDNLRAGLKNENAGHVVGEAGNDRIEFGLYHNDGGAITAYFDGYLNTPGRHEGIDIARSAGSDVFALLSGTVQLREEFGGDGLSTLSIYNADLDATIIYLHTNPNDGLNRGDHVDRGQRIAVEASRGASSAHTHVEMRPGKHDRASLSSNSTLENPIPTTFWMNRGYNICCQ